MGASWLTRAVPAQGHGLCDHNAFERAMNIVSSVPYTVIGLHTLRCAHPAPFGRLAFKVQRLMLHFRLCVCVCVCVCVCCVAK